MAALSFAADGFLLPQGLLVNHVAAALSAASTATMMPEAICCPTNAATSADSVATNAPVATCSPANAATLAASVASSALGACQIRTSTSSSCPPRVSRDSDQSGTNRGSSTGNTAL